MLRQAQGERENVQTVTQKVSLLNLHSQIEGKVADLTIDEPCYLIEDEVLPTVRMSPLEKEPLKSFMAGVK